MRAFSAMVILIGLQSFVPAQRPELIPDLFPDKGSPKSAGTDGRRTIDIREMNEIRQRMDREREGGFGQVRPDWQRPSLGNSDPIPAHVGPLDRHRIHDQLIVLSTQLECLLDDLSITERTRAGRGSIPETTAMRRQAMELVEIVDELGGRDLGRRLVDWVVRWQGTAERLRGIEDAHVAARLVRIEQTISEWGGRSGASGGAPLDLPLELGQQPAGLTIGEVAASLAGKSRGFADSIERNGRLFQPASYRQSMTAAVDDLARHAAQFESDLKIPGQSARAIREAERVREAWVSVSQNINEMARRGVPRPQADVLRQGALQMAPLVQHIQDNVINSVRNR